MTGEWQPCILLNISLLYPGIKKSGTQTTQCLWHATLTCSCICLVVGAAPFAGSFLSHLAALVTVAFIVISAQFSLMLKWSLLLQISVFLRHSVFQVP